jgi:ADP-heptose:LPS heptosyltransferase
MMEPAISSSRASLRPSAERPLVSGCLRIAATPLAAARHAGLFGRRRPPTASTTRILVVALHWLGDSILTLPLIAGLRRRWPEAELVVWSRERGRELWEIADGVDRVLVADEVASDRRRESASPPWRRARLHRQLRAERADLIVDATGVPGTALATLVARPGWSIGWSERGLGSLYDVTVSPGHADEHLIERRRRLAHALDLGEIALGHPRLSTPAGTPPSQEPGTLLHVGAGWSDKLWSAERWGELAASLGAAGESVTLVAGAGEAALLERARIQAGNVASAIPQTLPDLMRLVAAADRLVVADSGPAHLAAALGTPVTVLFGPTDPATCEPLGDVVKVVRAPDGDLARLEVGTLLDTLRGG